MRFLTQLLPPLTVQKAFGHIEHKEHQDCGTAQERIGREEAQKTHNREFFSCDLLRSLAAILSAVYAIFVLSVVKCSVPSADACSERFPVFLVKY